MASTAAQRLRQIAAETESLPRRLVRQAARDISKSVHKVLASHTGGDRSLSGAPAKLKAEVRTTDLGSVVTATITPGPRRNGGIWAWLEDGTRPHKIGKGQHPGTAAKHTWSKGVEPAVAKVVRDAGVEFTKVVD